MTAACSSGTDDGVGSDSVADPLQVGEEHRHVWRITMGAQAGENAFLEGAAGQEGLTLEGAPHVKGQGDGGRRVRGDCVAQQAVVRGLAAEPGQVRGAEVVGGIRQ